MKRNLLMLLLILFGLAASPLMAEQGAANITGNGLLGFTSQDIRELERLKDEDPTKFYKILTRRREKIRKKLASHLTLHSSATPIIVIDRIPNNCGNWILLARIIHAFSAQERK